MSDDWQRARRPEQKEERRDAILTAAACLLDAEGIEGTGLNAIAREAGISKANVYRYFESREAVLIRLFADEQAACFEDLGKRLTRVTTIRGVARACAAAFAAHPRYTLLLTSLATVLEHNVGEQAIAALKADSLVRMKPVVEALVRAVPKLAPERAPRFLLMLVTAVAGSWPHCHPAPAVASVLARPEFSVFRIEFEPWVREVAETLLHGAVVDD